MTGKPLSEYTRQRILDTGDTRLWAPLIQWYHERLVRYVESLGADHHLAEDIAQNTFIKAVQKFDQFQRDCDSFAPWLFAIARNELRSATRTMKSQEKGTGTTTWMQRQQEVTEDGVRLSQLQPTLEDRERAIMSAIAHPDFPYAAELVAKEFFQQLEYLVDQQDEPLRQKIVTPILERLQTAAERRYQNAGEVVDSTSSTNWRVFLLRQLLLAPAKLTAKLLGIPYSANIHKIGYRLQSRLDERSRIQ